ncbi:MAG: hypothetical protein ACREN7_03030 [Candidatus Dormibacteria bacterium]
MSRANGRLRRGLAGAPAAALLALLLCSCRGPAVPAGAALNQWLADVRSHQVAYAYTLLTEPAEQRTRYLPFFDGVNSSQAKFKVTRLETVSQEEVFGFVQISNPGERTRTIKVQMVEEGNGGDWLVGAPFTLEGARAIRYFK